MITISLSDLTANSFCSFLSLGGSEELNLRRPRVYDGHYQRLCSPIGRVFFSVLDDTQA